MEIDVLNARNTLSYGNSIGVLRNKESKIKFQHLLEKSLEAGQIYSKRMNSNKNRKIDKKLMDVCIEMESIFVSRMLREMRNTIPKEKFINGGFAEKIFEDMLYDNYALNLSKTSNLGIANMLYNELSRA